MGGSTQRIEVTVANQGGAAPASAVDRRYFSEAATWEHDVVRSVKRSRALAWTAAAMMTLVALMALGCLWLLIPLKSFEPYVVEVDKTTGFLEVKRALAPGDLEQSEAVTQMNVVRYLRARETYDPRAVKDNFDLAQLLSTGDAARALVELYSPANTEKPGPRAGPNRHRGHHRSLRAVRQQPDRHRPLLDPDPHPDQHDRVLLDLARAVPLHAHTDEERMAVRKPARLPGHGISARSGSRTHDQ